MNAFLTFLFEYRYLIIVVIAAAAVGVYYGYEVVNMPNSKKWAKLRELMLLWIADAENYYGSGTGSIKLRYCYDEFVKTYPILKLFMSFDKFSNLIDIVLAEFKVMLQTNEKLNTFIGG